MLVALKTQILFSLSKIQTGVNELEPTAYTQFMVEHKTFLIEVNSRNNVSIRTITKNSDSLQKLQQ